MAQVVGGFRVANTEEARNALRLLADHLRVPVPAPTSDGYVELPIAQHQIVVAADEVVHEWRARQWFEFPAPAPD